MKWINASALKTEAPRMLLATVSILIVGLMINPKVEKSLDTTAELENTVKTETAVADSLRKINGRKMAKISAQANSKNQ